MKIQVLNRDGSLSNMDISKIQKQTVICEKYPDTNQSELEVDSQIQFFDGISTEQIQETLIKTAIEKIDIDRPNWNFVASHLFLNNVYHKVGKKYGGKKGNPYSIPLSSIIETGVKLNRYTSQLGIGFDLEELSNYIKPERDEQFTYLGIKTLYDRYLVKDMDNTPIELPQQMFMLIAIFLAHKEENKMYWAKKFYDEISSFKVMLATPTLSNARRVRHQLSSCYVGSSPDNIEGIFGDYGEMALLSKFGGGIGWDYSKIRSIAGEIDGHPDVAGGSIPFLKIDNDIAVAVDQLGTRKGAIAVYSSVYTKDFYDFVDLRKNNGEERRRTHEIFPALLLNDRFMEAVQNNEEWIMIDPDEVLKTLGIDLSDLYGKAFSEAWDKVIASDVSRNTVSAVKAWRYVITSYFETGSPFLMFKDNANLRNPNSHSGIIRSSNLCTEIYQNTEPSEYLIQILMEDGSTENLKETDTIRIDGIGFKSANKLSQLDSINGIRIVAIEKIRQGGKTAVCNLGSVNLSKVNTKEAFESSIPTLVRMLDNVITSNYYPNVKTYKTVSQTRAIGAGVMGEAQMLAEAKIHWGTKEHYSHINTIMEMFSYNVIKASADLAEERGAYPEFAGSSWSKGTLPGRDFDNFKPALLELIKDFKGVYSEDEWNYLSDKASKGVRNGYMMAIAPTSSISILTGTSQAIEPIYKTKWFEENLSGLIPVVAPNISSHTIEYYPSAYEVDQMTIIEAGAVRQRWLDQGQSLNIFAKLGKVNGPLLSKIYFRGWELGLKATYYLRSQSPEENNDVEDRSMECVGCQ